MAHIILEKTAENYSKFLFQITQSAIDHMNIAQDTTYLFSRTAKLSFHPCKTTDIFNLNKLVFVCYAENNVIKDSFYYKSK